MMPLFTAGILTTYTTIVSIMIYLGRNDNLTFMERELITFIS